MGDRLRTGKPSWCVTSHPGQLSLLPSAWRKMSTSKSAVTLCGWGVNAGMVHSTSGWTCGWQVKLSFLVNTCHTWAPLLCVTQYKEICECPVSAAFRQSPCGAAKLLTGGEVCYLWWPCLMNGEWVPGTNAQTSQPTWAVGLPVPSTSTVAVLIEPIVSITL